MMKINMGVLRDIRLIEDLFKQDTYDWRKIEELSESGLINAREAGMMLGYIVG